MILCCGECLIDMLPRQTGAGEDAFAPHAGGAVFNTAVALGRLGADVGFYSGISNDLFGQILSDGLAASHVDASFAKRSDRPTTLAFVKLTNGQASYAFYDENTAGRMLGEDDLPDLPDNVNALFFGGISLVAEPAAETYATLMERAASHRVCMIDPNVRPSFITDEPRYRARITAMMANADIIKVSDEDLHWLCGEGDLGDLANGLIDKGAKLVCVTQGADGVTGYTARHALHVASKRAEVVDTVGAGDTFNAGLLQGLSKSGALTKDAISALSEDQLRAGLELGVTCAAITVSRAGANPPWAHEI